MFTRSSPFRQDSNRVAVLASQFARINIDTDDGGNLGARNSATNRDESTNMLVQLFMLREERRSLPKSVRPKVQIMLRYGRFTGLYFEPQ